MIVVCGKVLVGNIAIYDREFLLFFLSSTGQKAVVSNELWSAFRFRVLKNQDDSAKPEHK